jgi:EmrB/QacA subfamily drug resistance transporter
MADELGAPPISLQRRRAITAGLLLGMSLAALEATVVGTAMPTVIASLGGLAHYSWVFSAYLLTSTASVPIWGRLSDLYGRRLMYLIAVVFFLAGSVACGAAQSMLQLVAARAVQGLGAGGIIPLSMTIIGELYTLAERPRSQALFSGVWGVASVAGPLVGGYITDALSWRWVFYINIPFGILCTAVIAAAYPASKVLRRVRVDWQGAALLFLGVSALLVALGGDAPMLPWLAAAVALLTVFVLVEARAAEPILPLEVLRYPVMARTLGVVFLVGFSLFGAIAFVPLFVQTVMGGTATEAGQVLTPLFLGWVIMSVISAKATVKFGYRLVSMTGGALIVVGFGGLTLLTSDSARAPLFGACFVMGAGMGLQMLSLLLAVQHGAPRSQLGIATSLNQFSRSIGAAIGVAVMGAILAREVAGLPLPGPETATSSAMALSPMVRQQFFAALHRVFIAGALVSVAGLAGTLFLPRVDFSRGVPSGSGEELIAAEMANLEPEDEPVAVIE